MLCDLHCGRDDPDFLAGEQPGTCHKCSLGTVYYNGSAAAGPGADWQSLAAELYALTAAETEMSDSYEEYGEQLGQEASAQAIRTVLGQAGVDAAVQIRGNTCEVTLLHAEDRERAEAVLQSSCGTLSYTITAGGDAS